MFSTLISLLFMVCTTRAEVLTLKQALLELNDSPKIQKAISVSSEYSWKKVEAVSGLLPTFNITGNYLLAKQYALLNVTLPGTSAVTIIPQIIPAAAFSANMSFPLFDGLASFDRLAASQAFQRSSDRDLDWTRFQSERELILMFYRAVAAQALNEVADQNLKTLEEHLSDAQLFKKSGVSTKFDVLRVEVQVSEARSELLNSTDNISVSLLRLGEVLGKSMETRIPQGKLPEFSSDLASGVTPEMMERSDLKSLQEKRDGFESLATASFKYWVPKIGLYGQYQKYNNLSSDLLDFGSYRDAYSVGFQMSWNLFDGLLSIAKDRQAVEQKYQADKNVEINLVKFKNDIEFWKRKFNYYCAVYKSRLNDIGKASESVRLAKEGRKVGVRTNSDLLDAELELYRAKAGSINAQMGSIEAMINLELSLGKKVAQFQKQ